jgi:D-3-phosphoglycerate dehydrogenase
MGKTLGLIGAGNIGTELARRAIAFGMRVIAYDPLLKNHEFVDLVSIEELYTEADYISLHVPLSETTEGMMNSESIAQLKDGVVIVNTARGKVVAEQDMVAALESGKVRAYATDVWYSDPPDGSCPLYEAPHAIMTPHLGASSQENMLRIGDVVVRILEDFAQQTA